MMTTTELARKTRTGTVPVCYRRTACGVVQRRNAAGRWVTLSPVYAQHRAAYAAALAALA